MICLFWGPLIAAFHESCFAHATTREAGRICSSPSSITVRRALRPSCGCQKIDASLDGKLLVSTDSNYEYVTFPFTRQLEGECLVAPTLYLVDR